MSKKGQDRVIGLGGNNSVTLKDYFSASEKDRIKVLLGGDTPVSPPTTPEPGTDGVTKTGTAGNNNLTGTNNNDTLSGLAGDDVLRGEAGNDLLKGGRGVDKLYGGAGDDRLFAGDGNDILIGGAGADYLKGGTGRDVFDFRRIGGGVDTIADFESGRDTINVSKILRDSKFSSSNFEDYFKLAQLGSSTEVKIDVLGDKGNQFETLAVLSNTNVNQISAQDFVL